MLLKDGGRPAAELNRATWENEDTVAQYSRGAALETPEVLIFLKHKEEIWGKHILDIGCGGGRTSPVLTQIAGSYTGIDYSEAMIRSCKKRFEEGSFRRLDVRDMHPFEDNRFDFVLFSYCGLDYFTDQADRLAGLREIHRVLKKGRLFVFSSHNRNHEPTNPEPRLGLSRNPATQLKETLRYLRRKKNRRRNRNLESRNEEYALINDMAHDYSLLTYYTRKAQQIHQLEHTGFDVFELYDANGELLHPDGADEHSSWIYYVARCV